MGMCLSGSVGGWVGVGALAPTIQTHTHVFPHGFGDLLIPLFASFVNVLSKDSLICKGEKYLGVYLPEFYISILKYYGFEIYDG